MGVYQYNKDEQQINKVLKMHKDDLDSMGEQLESVKASGEARIAESEALLLSLGYSLPTRPSALPMNHQKSTAVIPAAESWEAIAQQAEKRYTYDVELEDLLTQPEFQSAYRDLDNINKEFQNSTKLSHIDTALMVVAAALQTARWVIMPEIGQTIDKAKRITDKEGDKLVKELKKKFVESRKDWPAKKINQGRKLRDAEGKTWKEIVFSGVPYDAIKGSKDLGLGLSGKTHRYKTLGHDPILGWIFGTSNILTDTLTTNNLMSYRVHNGLLTGQTVIFPCLFTETSNRIQDDRYNLPAAVFRQALHYKSDMYTKAGLPIPLLGVFNETLAGQLYSSQYDFLCFARDSAIESVSTIISILINMIIGLIHGLYYSEAQDGERSLYEIRTRKILLYSNSLASVGNVAATAITKKLKMLDIGGLLVTISRLYTDSRFIARVKEEYIQSKLNNNWLEIMRDSDELLKVF